MMKKMNNGERDYICGINIHTIPTRLPREVIEKHQQPLYEASADTNRCLLHEIINCTNKKMQEVRDRFTSTEFNPLITAKAWRSAKKSQNLPSRDIPQGPAHRAHDIGRTYAIREQRYRQNDSDYNQRKRQKDCPYRDQRQRHEQPARDTSRT